MLCCVTVEFLLKLKRGWLCQPSVVEQTMIKKRFIAGAICPSCGEMDSIQMYMDSDGHQIKECVECEFSETLSSEPGLKGDLPETRIPREEKVLEDSMEIVRIIPLPK